MSALLRLVSRFSLTEYISHPQNEICVICGYYSSQKVCGSALKGDAS
jgi:hypothetical protein